ncbi:jg18872 [Pararge aegeria aegeria]|uniref:Jg18872 protein n=1 Tax=Pararge aegeria aegeria TaxID=348720 RepID=A0A8S4RZ08_9NEOP|nr:jg18872 [Pararge aegeria aegeria]
MVVVLPRTSSVTKNSTPKSVYLSPLSSFIILIDFVYAIQCVRIWAVHSKYNFNKIIDTVCNSDTICPAADSSGRTSGTTQISLGAFPAAPKLGTEVRTNGKRRHNLASSCLADNEVAVGRGRVDVRGMQFILQREWIKY